MRDFRRLWLLLRHLALLIVLEAASFGQCVPFSKALNHMGATRCISGKVIRVEQGNGGVHFVDFCEDFRVCPFTVAVFPRDLKQVGDIRRLTGRQVEVEGEVKGYDGRAEIVLQRVSQLRGDAAKIPCLRRNTTWNAAGTTAPEPSTHRRPASNPRTRDNRRQSVLRIPASRCHPAMSRTFAREAT